MHLQLAIFWIFFLALSILRTDAYTFSEYLNTDSGYCESDGYDRVPVGQTGYNDKTCERIECSTGFRHVSGCGKVLKPDDTRCRVVRGDGHYPDCCPDIKCDVTAMDNDIQTQENN